MQYLPLEEFQFGGNKQFVFFLHDQMDRYTEHLQNVVESMKALHFLQMPFTHPHHILETFVFWMQNYKEMSVQCLCRTLTPLQN